MVDSYTIWAPGSILLVGAYAILDAGKSGVSMALNVGTTTTVRPAGIPKLHLPDFGIELEGDFWRRQDQGDERILRFTREAVRWTSEALKLRGITQKKLAIESKNDDALKAEGGKTGLSSSASATVSMVAAILAAHGVHDRELTQRVSRYAHYSAQGGVGSGYDVSTATLGSQVFVGHEPPQGDFTKYLDTRTTRPEPSPLLEDWHPLLIFTGRPASTTQLVEGINQYRERYGEEYREWLTAYNQTNERFAERLTAGEFDPTLLQESFEKRKTLGIKAGVWIESPEHTAILEELLDHGASCAGLLGAGGGDSVLALSASQKEQEEIISWAKEAGLYPMPDITLRKEGYEKR